MGTQEFSKNIKNVEEKELSPSSGGLLLLIVLATYLIAPAIFVMGIITANDGNTVAGVIAIILGSVLLVVAIILSCGFHIIRPNEELILLFFGKYYGTIKKDGFYFLNPFATEYNPAVEATQPTLEFSSTSETVNKPATTPNFAARKKISIKTQTLKNEKQKVNDVMGNPIIIGSVVIWRVENPTKAVFNVENYQEYLSIQCDSVIRNIARMYPYDDMENDSEEKTLRGSSQEIADSMKKELQEKVLDAGLEIQEVRITNLAYSDEIAAAMLQRQQAVAIIAARQKIVEGAVSMVKMAIEQLSEEEVVVLDEERKAAMVSNLLVVLCGNKDAQPIVNSGSIY